MRNLIFGAIGTLWGGLILLGTFLRGGPSGQGAYFTGQLLGLLFGVLLFGAGLYYLIDGIKKLQAGPQKKRRKRKRLRPRAEEEMEV